MRKTHHVHTMPKTRAGMIDVTHHIGAELARLLCQHPRVKLIAVTGRNAAGQKLGDVFPSFAGTDYTIEAELGDGIDGRLLSNTPQRQRRYSTSSAKTKHLVCSYWR